jgi:hypothetical protein
MKKQLIAFAVLFFAGNVIFATSPSKEDFRIENHTTKELFIQLELVERVVDVVHWYQNIGGVILSITNEYQLSKAGILLTGQSKKIISYYPAAPLISENNWFSEMRSMSILKKLHAIIKSLVITDSDGNVIFTLDELREENLRIDRWGNSVYYILEIRSGTLEN